MPPSGHRFEFFEEMLAALKRNQRRRASQTALFCVFGLETISAASTSVVLDSDKVVSHENIGIGCSERTDVFPVAGILAPNAEAIKSLSGQTVRQTGGSMGASDPGAWPFLCSAEQRERSPNIVIFLAQ